MTQSSDTTQLLGVEDVLRFWFGDLDASGSADKEHAKRWWVKDSAFDTSIRERFGALHAALNRGEHANWCDAARGRLAYIIVLDQFSRNMYRDTPAMFASDARALAATSAGIELGIDRQLRLDERAFFYMPLMHSERLADQERCVQLYGGFASELSESQRGGMNGRATFAEKHRDIVKRFGRFPHRNAILGRASTPAETEFLSQPGSSF